MNTNKTLMIGHFVTGAFAFVSACWIAAMGTSLDVVVGVAACQAAFGINLYFAGSFSQERIKEERVK